METQVVLEIDNEDIYTIFCPSPMEWRARDGLLESVKQQAQGRPCRGIILDLANVSYINSAGLAAIFNLRKFAQSLGAEVVLARPTPTILRLLATANLPALMPVTRSLDEAREQLSRLQMRNAS